MTIHSEIDSVMVEAAKMKAEPQAYDLKLTGKVMEGVPTVPYFGLIRKTKKNLLGRFREEVESGRWIFLD